MKGFFYSTDQQETRDINYPPHSKPVGLAMSSKGTACIAWKLPYNNKSTEVRLYGREYVNLLERLTYNLTVLRDMWGPRAPSMPPSLKGIEIEMLTTIFSSAKAMEAESYGKYALCSIPSDMLHGICDTTCAFALRTRFGCSDDLQTHALRLRHTLIRHLVTMNE